MKNNIDWKQLQEHVFFGPTWLRGFFTLMFAAIYFIVRILVCAVAIFQFLTLVFTGKLNAQLLSFGESLSQYNYEIARYLTFNVEKRPFPLDNPWPSAKQKVDVE